MKSSILFVCLANICRSPAFEATLRHLALEGKHEGVVVDSCGVGWQHVGEHPDPRTFAAAKKRGILIDHLAQQFSVHFFDEFDYIFAVDADIVLQLQYQARNEQDKKKLFLATCFSERFKDQDIPDPYYMGPSGFDDVMEMVVDACQGILHHVIMRSKNVLSKRKENH